MTTTCWRRPSVRCLCFFLFFILIVSLSLPDTPREDDEDGDLSEALESTTYAEERVKARVVEAQTLLADMDRRLALATSVHAMRLRDYQVCA